MLPKSVVDAFLRDRVDAPDAVHHLERVAVDAAA